MGTGVPRPVHPKSQMQRSATAKPNAEGMAATQRQRIAPAVSMRKPSNGGSNQNHSARKAAPAAREASVISKCETRFVSGEAPVCRLVMSNSITPKKKHRGDTSLYAVQGCDVTSNKKHEEPGLRHHRPGYLSAPAPRFFVGAILSRKLIRDCGSAMNASFS